MNTVEILTWLQQNTSSLHIDINDHRSYYRDLEAFLSEEERYSDMTDEVRAECVRRGQVVLLQVYPSTPVGFFCVVHYDIEQAIGAAFDVVSKMKGGGQRT